MADIQLQRGKGRYDRTPNTWWPVRWVGRQELTANVVCANGHPGLISDHAIAVDGTVSPSVICPEPGCTFHAFIRLEGWPGEA